MLSSNQQMDFYNGYLAALDEVYSILTSNPDDIREAYEQALEFVRVERGES